MDSERFDRLTRSFSQVRSRRQTLRGMAAVALGAVGLVRVGTMRGAAQIVVCPVCLTFDSAARQCVADPTQNGFACNDANACTQTDTCQNGVCTGGNPVVCTPLDQCHDAGVCNGDNGVCSNPAKPDGTACNAGNACTTGDTCQAGSCVAGTPVVCPAPDACYTAGTCDPAKGGCSAPTRTAATCASGRIKGAPCDCDGTCCSAGQNCVDTPGRRRCQ
jgi:hypothetical protein